MLKEQALVYAGHYHDIEFKASNGWLDAFKKRHSIVFNAICGEARDVSQTTVDDWHQKIPTLITGYDKKDIANCDETALFFRAIPQKSLAFKGEKCFGGKLSKERLSVLLCAFADGKFEKPLIIGKAVKPRCFKNIDVSMLPCEWHSNKKAWMTLKIMEGWLIKLNQRMVQQKRNILLFMDNASSHPKLNLSNIKLIFFPANTTSVLQPMDQGVIYTTKLYYRKKVLSRLCREMDTVENVSDLAKTINVLDAIHWLANAVNSVSPHCVEGAFKKAGFKFWENVDEFDPEDDMILSELASLMRRTSCSGMTIAEFISMDDNVYTECDSIDPIAIAEACELAVGGEAESETEIESSESQSDSQSQPQEMLTSNEMVLYVQRLKETALAKGNTRLLNKISDCMMILEDDISKKMCKQTTIGDFFIKKE